MTPITLAYKLQDILREILKNYLMEESDLTDGERVMRAPNVWLQHLPEKLYEGVPDPADFPFALIIIGGGVGIADNKMPLDIAIFVGGYDDGQIIDGGVRDRQGWLIPVELCWRTLTELVRNPLHDSFKLNTEQISWEIPLEQPAPQWFGTIHTSWEAHVPPTHYDLRNMDFHTDPSCERALTEKINT